MPICAKILPFAPRPRKLAAMEVETLHCMRTRRGETVEKVLII